MAGVKQFYVLMLDGTSPAAKLLSDVRDQLVRSDDETEYPTFHCAAIDLTGPMLTATPTGKSKASGLGSLHIPFHAVVLIAQIEHGKALPFGFDPSNP